MKSASNTNSYVLAALSMTAGMITYLMNRRHKRQLLLVEAEDGSSSDVSDIQSLLLIFKDLTLASDSSVKEANQKRTASYYQKARDAHLCSIIAGISYSKRISLRKKEESKIMFYHNNKKSHRTVIIMCDEATRSLLVEARTNILDPLKYSFSVETEGVWIPEYNMLNAEHLHVTVAIPWWWRSLDEDNKRLSNELFQRFKQTLLLKFHHPFAIELERIVLLGGKTLVALWRCVGNRISSNGFSIDDRHGTTKDPMVWLRKEIVRCFTTESPDNRRQPLTFSHLQQIPLTRQNTIESKSPGISQSDGFIHTTLARLPVNCLAPYDVHLDEIHRLCREASAFCAGHRMIVSSYRFLETTGKGGDSNPCVQPLFDEVIDAPRKLKVDIGGKTSEPTLLGPKDIESSQTVGPVRHIVRPSMDGLFEPLQKD